MGHHDANDPFKPSERQVANAVSAIRSLVVRAKTDDYPADIAAPTALYLGIAVTVLFSGIGARALAALCNIQVPNAHEFARLVEIASRSEWIRHDVIQAVIFALASKGDSPDPPTEQPRIALPDPVVQPDPQKPTQIADDSRNGVLNLLPRRLTRAAIQTKPDTGSVPGGPVTIMGLNQNTCRWPLGDPRATDFRYCGDHKPSGKPYCATHHSLAYTPKAAQKSGVA